MAMTLKARQGYAKLMTAFAKEFLKDGLESWKGEEDMIACTRADAKDYREVARLIRTKGAAPALAYIRELDTAARDCVPDQVWDALVRDEDEEALTRQQWDDEITRRHIAVLEDKQRSLGVEIERAKARLGSPAPDTLEARLLENRLSY